MKRVSTSNANLGGESLHWKKHQSTGNALKGLCCYLKAMPALATGGRDLIASSFQSLGPCHLYKGKYLCWGESYILYTFSLTTCFMFFLKTSLSQFPCYPISTPHDNTEDAGKTALNTSLPLVVQVSSLD